MAKEEPRPAPADQVPAGAWPDNLPDDTPPQVQLAAAVAIRLDEARRPLSYQDTEGATGVSHQTIHNIVNGRTWPDLHTIALLENGLEARLWGDEHLPERVKRRRTRRART